MPGPISRIPGVPIIAWSMTRAKCSAWRKLCVLLWCVCKTVSKERHTMNPILIGVSALLLAGACAAEAGVVVSASGNTAVADISLASGGRSYTADVAITFSGAQNLSPTELNLSAQIVDPSDPGLLARLPACILPVLGCVTVDPNFPVLITIEPLSLASG